MKDQSVNLCIPDTHTHPDEWETRFSNNELLRFTRDFNEDKASDGIGYHTALWADLSVAMQRQRALSY